MNYSRLLIFLFCFCSTKLFAQQDSVVVDTLIEHLDPIVIRDTVYTQTTKTKVTQNKIFLYSKGSAFKQFSQYYSCAECQEYVSRLQKYSTRQMALAIEGGIGYRIGSFFIESGFGMITFKERFTDSLTGEIFKNGYSYANYTLNLGFWMGYTKKVSLMPWIGLYGEQLLSIRGSTADKDNFDQIVSIKEERKYNDQIVAWSAGLRGNYRLGPQVLAFFELASRGEMGIVISGSEGYSQRRYLLGSKVGLSYAIK